MEKNTEIFITDNLNKTKTKLRFINVGLTQNGCAWDYDDITGLFHILSDIEKTIGEMCERIRQERKQE